MVQDAFQLDPTRLHLFGSFDSANLVVRFILEELEMDYRFVEINRANRMNRSPEYLKLNPQGLLPVLIDPDQKEPLFETAGILLYLADKTRRLAPQLASPDRGRLLSWLFFLSNTLHADLRISFRPERYMSDNAGMPHLAAALETRIEQGFSHLETAFQGSAGPYMLGSTPSILDFYAAACVRWYQLYPAARVFDADRWPGLHGVLLLLQDRPSVQRAIAKEEIGGSAFLEPQRPNLDEAALLGT